MGHNLMDWLATQMDLDIMLDWHHLSMEERTVVRMALLMDLPMLTAYHALQALYANCNCDALCAFLAAAAAAAANGNDLNDDVENVDADTNLLQDLYLHNHDYLCRIEPVVYLFSLFDDHALAADDCDTAFVLSYSFHFSQFYSVHVHSM